MGLLADRLKVLEGRLVHTDRILEAAGAVARARQCLEEELRVEGDTEPMAMLIGHLAGYLRGLETRLVGEAG